MRPYSSVKRSGENDAASAWLTSSAVGHTSRRYTGPSLPCPSGSVVRSALTVPASAYATTSGGEAR